MKDVFERLNKVFENHFRLKIMSLLMVSDEVDFLALKSGLKISDGNLASHISKLEEAGYLTVHKTFVGKKTQTVYRSTSEGKKAFEEHLSALEEIIHGMGG
ncbi:MAG: transcriptional regulator [Bacteroidia bacterium]|nr:transcriptional regulator [Bacteroidia bacterium]